MKNHISLAKAALVLEVDPKTLVAWSKNRGFPAKALHYAKRIQWKVDIADMAKWIEDQGHWGYFSDGREILKIIKAKLASGAGANRRCSDR